MSDDQTPAPTGRAPRITDEDIRTVAAETGEPEEIVRQVAEAIECCEDEQDL